MAVKVPFSYYCQTVETCTIFSQSLLISFKHDKNKGSFLVRDILKSDNQPGSLKCPQARCKISPFIHKVDKTSGPKRSIKINDKERLLAYFFVPTTFWRHAYAGYLPYPRTAKWNLVLKLKLEKFTSLALPWPYLKFWYAKPKSVILQTKLRSSKMFLAAKSRWITCKKRH